MSGRVTQRFREHAVSMADRAVTDAALPVPGCVVRARLIGALEAEQKESGSWVRNDRLIAVAVHAQTYQNSKSLADLRPHLLKEITEFFATYNKLRDRKFKCLGTAGPKDASKIVERDCRNFATSQESGVVPGSR
ncbi:MAG TPA: inorganic diphosphatase [Xanthobacteraceae bacterium]|jgi:inorganic pyrophosphatase|nr:inorganic diphosphatase [Xanthobacteraceae bacterium]